MNLVKIRGISYLVTIWVVDFTTNQQTSNNQMQWGISFFRFKLWIMNTLHITLFISQSTRNWRFILKLSTHTWLIIMKNLSRLHIKFINKIRQRKDKVLVSIPESLLMLEWQTIYTYSPLTCELRNFNGKNNHSITWIKIQQQNWCQKKEFVFSTRCSSRKWVG